MALQSTFNYGADIEPTATCIGLSPKNYLERANAARESPFGTRGMECDRPVNSCINTPIYYQSTSSLPLIWLFPPLFCSSEAESQGTE